jgi:hypothetical protein
LLIYRCSTSSSSIPAEQIPGLLMLFCICKVAVGTHSDGTVLWGVCAADGGPYRAAAKMLDTRRWSAAIQLTHQTLSAARHMHAVVEVHALAVQHWLSRLVRHIACAIACTLALCHCLHIGTPPSDYVIAASMCCSGFFRWERRLFSDCKCRQMKVKAPVTASL